MKDPIRVIGIVFLLIAVIGFEALNYATTEYAVNEMFGGIEFYFLTWGSLVATAFCLADIVGVMRIMTPETAISDEPLEVQLITLAWAVAAIVNGFFSWYAFTDVMASRSVGNEILDRETIVMWVPMAMAFVLVVIRFSLVNSIVTGVEGIIHKKKSVRPGTYRPAPVAFPKRDTGFKPQSILKPNINTQIKPINNKPKPEKEFGLDDILG